MRSVLVDYDSLRTDLDDLRGSQPRLVRLALVESVAAFGPMAAITRFRERFGGVSFNLRLMPAPRVVEAVLQDQCDLGVSFCVQPHPDIVTLASVHEPIVAAAPLGHPVATMTSVTLSELTRWPLALPDVRQILDRVAAVAGLRLAPVLSSNTFETLREFVRAGAGCAVLPMRAGAREARGGSLSLAPLSDLPFRNTTIELVALRSRRLPRVLKSFVEVLAAEIAAAP